MYCWVSRSDLSASGERTPNKRVTYISEETWSEKGVYHTLIMKNCLERVFDHSPAPDKVEARHLAERLKA